MPRRKARRWGRRAPASTLAHMRTLLKIALAGALAAVIVKWTRGWLADTSDPAGGRRDVPTINPEPLSAAEPLRGEDLRAGQNGAG